MPKGKPKKGLRVKHSSTVAQYAPRARLMTPMPPGFYIWVWKAGKWYALLNLCFARERDALRAAAALTAAGLDCHSAMMRAHPLTVKQVACECLQW